MMNILSLYKYNNPGKYMVVGPSPCHCVVCRAAWDAAGKSLPHKAGSCPYDNDKPSDQRVLTAFDKTGEKIMGEITNLHRTDEGITITYMPFPGSCPEYNEPRQYPYPLGRVPAYPCYREIAMNSESHPKTPKADAAQLIKSMDDNEMQSLYVRYHEIGNRPEKSLGTGSFTWDPGDDDKPMTMSINDASWDEVMKILGKCATDTANYKNPKETKDMSYLGGPSQHVKCDETHGLTKTLEGIAKESPENAQIMKRVAENAEYERNERIEKALKGSIELTLLQGFPGKNFVLKHFRDNKEHTTYGTAYPGYDADMETAKKFEKPTVLLLSSGDPYIYGTYKALCNLIKSLEDNALPYVIKFFD